MVELAWSWLRYQPDSAMSQWYHKRFAAAGKRMRRVGIVALARRLVIALWRYLEHGRSRPARNSSPQRRRIRCLKGQQHDRRSTRPRRPWVTTSRPSIEMGRVGNWGLARRDARMLHVVRAHEALHG